MSLLTRSWTMRSCARDALAHGFFQHLRGAPVFAPCVRARLPLPTPNDGCYFRQVLHGPGNAMASVSNLPPELIAWA